MGASGGDTRGQMAVRTVEAVAVVAAARMRRAMELGWGQMVVRRIVARVAGADEGSGEDGDEYVPNPCSLYLLNLGIDVSPSPEPDILKSDMKLTTSDNPGNPNSHPYPPHHYPSRGPYATGQPP